MSFNRISILVDNFAKAPRLAGEHGFSCLIQTRDRNILYDTGCGRGFAQNARRMNIELFGVDDIVLSHGHYDHTGGVAAALHAAPDAGIVYHESIMDRRYSRHPQETLIRDIGMPESSRRAIAGAAASGRRCRYVRDVLELSPGILVFTCPEPPSVSMEWPFLRGEAGTVETDFFTDEISLLIQGKNAACLITGCAHHGIEPIFRHAASLSPVPIRYIVGGTHLDGATDDKVAVAAAFLRSTGAELYLGHCTGMHGYARLYVQLGNQLHPIGSGVEIEPDL